MEADLELLAADAVIARLQAALARAGGSGRGAALAFDGDGTLWRGDIGDDFFEATLAADRYFPATVEAMRALGRESGLAALDHDDAVVVADRLYRGYLVHEVPEEPMCELIAWACAGWREEEVAALVRDVLAGAPLEKEPLEARRHPELAAVIAWARSAGVATYLVSASPRPVVEAAGAALGFDRAHIVATTAPFVDGVMQRDVERPIPYGPGKAALLQTKLDGKKLLAAFGDNIFDVAMLQAAELGVVVDPKPRLAKFLETSPWRPVRILTAT